MGCAPYGEEGLFSDLDLNGGKVFDSYLIRVETTGSLTLFERCS